jgi:hypothetical protein
MLSHPAEELLNKGGAPHGAPHGAPTFLWASVRLSARSTYNLHVVRAEKRAHALRNECAPCGRSMWALR